MIQRDEEILGKLKRGNADGYKELFDFYYIPLTAYALKFCNSENLAEDIVQDLFIKIWDQKLFLNFENQISPYLFKAVKNNALKIVQRDKNVYFETLENQISLLYDENFIDDERLEISKKKLYDHINQLPEKGKEVFIAIVINNLSYKEVAENLGITVNTVKTHYSRALKQLRKGLNMDSLLILILIHKTFHSSSNNSKE